MLGVTPTHHQELHIYQAMLLSSRQVTSKSGIRVFNKPVVTPGDITTHQEPNTDQDKSLGVTPTQPGFTRLRVTFMYTVGKRSTVNSTARTGGVVDVAHSPPNQTRVVRSASSIALMRTRRKLCLLIKSVPDTRLLARTSTSTSLGVHLPAATRISTMAALNRIR
jgi:hypothetical protein